MINKNIRILLAVVALIALSACSKSANLPSNDVNTPAIEKDKTNDEAGSGKKTNVDECQKGCSILNGTGMFSKEFCSDSCWAAAAKDTGDVSICDTKVKQDNDLVLFACYINVAETKKDTKYCDKIGKTSSDLMRAGCYNNVAKLAKDPSLCEGIKGNLMYNSCVSEAKGE